MMQTAKIIKSRIKKKKEGIISDFNTKSKVGLKLGILINSVNAGTILASQVVSQYCFKVGKSILIYTVLFFKIICSRAGRMLLPCTFLKIIFLLLEPR